MLTRTNRKLFYNSYILPHLDFCCISWGDCSSTLEDKTCKIPKEGVYLDCDVYAPSAELF